MNDQHLTQEQRYQIYALSKTRITQKEIADILGKHSSNISKELKRNKGKKGYRPKQAHHLATTRKSSNVKQINQEYWLMVEAKLNIQWSPEQIAQWVGMSTESIYQYIYKDKSQGGQLYHNLRCRKKKKKRYAQNDSRGCIKNARRIDDRPKLVSNSMIQLLIHMPAITITSDNGKEFAYHHKVSKELNINFYFAHPYSPWERGTNENTNGLIRQYFPKDKDFREITSEEINLVMYRLNNRPRKRLGYKTPNEVLFGK